MAFETDIAERYIYGKLSGNAAITTIVGTRIYVDVAPQGAAFPFIVYSMLSAEDVRAVGAMRIATNMQYLVKAVAQTGQYTGQIGTLADTIDAVLHGADGTQGSVTGGLVISSYRLRPWKQAEVDSGVHYRSKGGIYALMAQST